MNMHGWDTPATDEFRRAAMAEISPSLRDEPNPMVGTRWRSKHRGEDRIVEVFDVGQDFYWCRNVKTGRETKVKFRNWNRMYAEASK